jgi:hypothetical protein
VKRCPDTAEEYLRQMIWFGVYPKLLEADGRLRWGFKRSQFIEACARYRLTDDIAYRYSQFEKDCKRYGLAVESPPEKSEENR